MWSVLELVVYRDGGAKMQYSVIGGSTDVVTVEEGVLKSGSLTGRAALHITAIEESGISQTLVIVVKVSISEGIQR